MPIPAPIARRRRERNVRELRLAVECLPLGTREAMLRGVRESPRIIVGAYTDGEGGVCPRRAAHRHGGRTNFLSFARSWDRFTGAGRRRAASAHELCTLIALLEGSLLDEERVDLGGVIAEHSALRRAREREQADPTGEIVARRLRAPRWWGRRRERVDA